MGKNVGDKVWTRDNINHMLYHNPLAVERAMVRLYSMQTSDEATASTARWLNGQGFSATTAKRGSYYARWVGGGRHLTGSHLQRAREIALWHSRQLVTFANHSQGGDK